LRTVADAVGMSELARRTGLDRSHLYSALSEAGNPRLDTMATVAHAFGLRVTLALAAKPSRHKTHKLRKALKHEAA
jgi:probable addiction module antidote protein